MQIKLIVVVVGLRETVSRQLKMKSFVPLVLRFQLNSWLVYSRKVVKYYLGHEWVKTPNGVSFYSKDVIAFGTISKTWKN